MKLTNLRLLLTLKCQRACAGCCNKDFDTSSFPIISDFSNGQYDKIYMTGGEPLLVIPTLETAIDRIKTQSPHTKRFMYTALYDGRYVKELLESNKLDGVTVTVHNLEDVEQFLEMQKVLKHTKNLDAKSLRVNAFKETNLQEKHIDKSVFPLRVLEKEWIKNAAVPEDAIGFFRA